MPRTTIFHSRFITLILALAAAPAVANAQDRPATHTVKAGDTLWDLAKRYLGDPFLWSQIYRLNTAVVEDPHWIYPGEVLRLAAGEGVTAVPAEDTPAPQAQTPQASPKQAEPATGGEEYPMPEFARRRPTGSTEGLRLYTDSKPSSLHASDFFSSGFLTEGRDLPLGQMLGSVQPPQIRFMQEGKPAVPHETVGIRAPAGGSYAAGDTLLVFQFENGFQGYGDLIIPTGLVRVIGQADQQYLAEVIQLFGAVRNGQNVMPAEKFNPGPKARPVPTADSLTGRVLGARGFRELKILSTRLFIDLGREQGVAPGDIFEIRRVPGPRPLAADNINDLMAQGQVVHVGDRSATIILQRVISPDIPSGMTVRRVAKLPS